jgi:hypothetical protein
MIGVTDEGTGDRTRDEARYKEPAKDGPKPLTPFGVNPFTFTHLHCLRR